MTDRDNERRKVTQDLEVLERQLERLRFAVDTGDWSDASVARDTIASRCGMMQKPLLALCDDTIRRRGF